MTPPPTVSLADFSELRGEVGGVRIDSQLPIPPYVPAEDIDVNVDRIARAARIGHLGSLSFRGYSEQTQYTPGVDSVGEDGSASASFSASATRAPRIDTKSTIGKYFQEKGQSIIRLNFEHEDLNEINLREVKPWSHFLDKAMREGLRSSSNQKLTDRLSYRGLLTSIWLGPSVFWAALGGIEDGIEDFTFKASIYNSLLMLHGQWTKGQPLSEEFTLVPTIPIDRLGLIQAYTRTRKFVKVKKPK